MMTTRRSFLGGLLAGAAVAASGCRSAEAATGRPTAGRHAIGLTPSRARVVIVRPSVYSSVAAAVRAAIEAFGGVPGLRAGDTVCLKPALNSERGYPSTAAPATLQAIAEVVLDARAKPFIADRTMFARSTERALERTGITAMAKALGIRALPLDDEPTVALSDARATHWPGHTVHLYAPPLEATHLINVCTPRTHRIAGFTLALKNNVGLVSGGRRMLMHGPGGFAERVAELNLFTRPALVVLDGRQGFIGGGPDEGTLAELDFLAVSDDPCAIDAVATARLRAAGAHADNPILAHAATLGIGVAEPTRIDVVEVGAG